MRHTLSAFVFALVLPSAAFAQTDAPVQVLSANPFGLIVKWPNVEYERRVTESATIGGSSSYFADSGRANAAILMRWYPQRTALDGLFVGARAGAYRFETYRYDARSYGETSTILPGAGVEIGYNWLLGPGRNVAVGIGFGLTRILNVGVSSSVPEVLPSARLVNIGIAF